MLQVTVTGKSYRRVTLYHIINCNFLLLQTKTILKTVDFPLFYGKFLLNASKISYYIRQGVTCNMLQGV